MPNPEDKSMNPNDDAAGDRPAHEPSLILQSFEARLAQLSPRADRLDRERLIFLAGQASVADADADRSPLVHDWRRHPGWPAAFATVSALAATLLAMLIIRPADTNDLPTASREAKSIDRFVNSSQPTMKQASGEPSIILSTRDALHGDIETMLAAPSNEQEVWPDAINHRPRPALTPSAWQKVSGDAEPHVRPAGSSSLPVIRGIHS